MSVRWISRKSDRLRVNLFARCRHATGHDRDVVLVNITPEGCCMTGFGRVLQIGQPVIIRLETDDALPGTVRWISEDQAGVQFDVALPRARVEYLRSQHSTFMAEVAQPELMVRRSLI